MGHRLMVFTHVPKTAGSTFDFILQNSFGLRACDADHSKRSRFRQRDLDLARKLFPGLRYISGHNLMDPLSFSIPNPFFMTFLRDPVARVISRYQDTVLKGTNKRPFEDCIHDDLSLHNRQVIYLAGGLDLSRAKQFLRECGFVGLLEKFDLSLQVLGRLSPYKLNLKYMRRRTATARRIEQEIRSNNRLIELIREKNQLDLELYSFAVNEIFPGMCAKAGFSPSDTVPSYEAYDHEVHPKFLAFSAYNMLFYRQACKWIYRRHTHEAVNGGVR